MSYIWGGWKTLVYKCTNISPQFNLQFIVQWHEHILRVFQRTLVHHFIDTKWKPMLSLWLTILAKFQYISILLDPISTSTTPNVIQYEARLFAYIVSLLFKTACTSDHYYQLAKPTKGLLYPVLTSKPSTINHKLMDLLKYFSAFWCHTV